MQFYDQFFALSRVSARGRHLLRSSLVSVPPCRPELIADLTPPRCHSFRLQRAHQRGVFTMVEPVAHNFNDEKAQRAQAATLREIIGEPKPKRAASVATPGQHVRGVAL